MGNVKKENRVTTFFKGVKSQWNNTTWTDKAHLKKQTITVVFVSIILAAIIICVDFNVLHLISKFV